MRRLLHWPAPATARWHAHDRRAASHVAPARAEHAGDVQPANPNRAPANKPNARDRVLLAYAEIAKVRTDRDSRHLRQRALPRRAILRFAQESQPARASPFDCAELLPPTAPP